MDEEQKDPQTPPTTEKPEINPSPIQEVNPVKKSSPWLLAIVLILVIVALAAAGFFAYQNYQLKQKGSSGKETPTNSAGTTTAPLPTPTPDLLANWLTFSKESFCYSFKYPREVTFNDEEIVRLSLWGPTQKQDTEFYDGLSLTFSDPLQVGNSSLSDFVESKVAAVQTEGIAEVTKPKEAILINGLNGFTFTIKGLGTFQNIYLQSPDKSCTVEITNATVDPTNQGFQEIVDKILSTFKFVD